ncbi:BatD family protein [Ensifer sp. D2-11]
MMTRASRLYRLIAALFCWIAAAGPALSADPLARASLQSKGTLYAGQQILIDVDVLVPNYFLQPPQFPVIDLPGAIVTLDDGRALYLNETIDGAAYSGIRRTYIVTPQSPGDFSLPPAVITFGYAAVPPQATRGEVTLPPLRFTVREAPESAGERPGVVAAKVSIRQELDQDPAVLKAGDTLVRTITVRAEGLRAMMIPEPDFSTPEGVRLYRQDPALSEETDRNGQSIAGIRKDVASYLFREPGTYVLPAVTLSWFDPASAATQSTNAPAVSVTVAAAATRSPAIAPPAPEPQRPPFDWLHLAVIGGGVLLIALVLWASANGLSRLEAWWQERRSKERQSEPAFFRQVEQACRSGSDEAIARALDAWSRKAGVTPLEYWLGRFADAETQQVYQDRQGALYGLAEASSRPVRGDLFLPGLKKARKIWLTQGEKAPGRRVPALLPLNPTMP